MSHMFTSIVHKTASLDDEHNSVYCQSRATHNINTFKPMRICIERSPQHVQERDRTRSFLITNTTP